MRVVVAADSPVDAALVDGVLILCPGPSFNHMVSSVRVLLPALSADQAAEIVREYLPASPVLSLDQITRDAAPMSEQQPAVASEPRRVSALAVMALTSAVMVPLAGALATAYMTPGGSRDLEERLDMATRLGMVCQGPADTAMRCVTRGGIGVTVTVSRDQDLISTVVENGDQVGVFYEAQTPVAAKAITHNGVVQVLRGTPNVFTRGRWFLAATDTPTLKWMEQDALVAPEPDPS